MSEEFVDIRVGSGAINLFERIEIPIFNAFCEFIDNSLQSYIEHEEELRNVAQTRCKACPARQCCSPHSQAGQDA